MTFCILLLVGELPQTPNRVFMLCADADKSAYKEPGNKVTRTVTAGSSAGILDVLHVDRVAL